MYFVDVALPLPLRQNFTYQIREEEATYLQAGMRVVVPFGKSKIYTAIVLRVHQQKPLYETKEIEFILDENILITPSQIALFQWVSTYYMSTLGEVIKIGLPPAFLLESETIIEKTEEITDTKTLTNDEFLIYEALNSAHSLTTKEASKIIQKKNAISVLKSLLEKNSIRITEKIYEKYTPKLIKYIRFTEKYQNFDNLKDLLDGKLLKTEQQKRLVISYITLQSQKKNNIQASDLLEKAEVTSSVLKKLISNEIFEEYYLQTDRVSFSENVENTNELTEKQQIAFDEIKDLFTQKNTILLHGVSSSGKTEIYIKLIEEYLSQGKQVLYLLPEIGITTQLIQRLERFFGDKMSVYHSKYSSNERVEVWHNILNNREKAQLIVGVRSAVFLPFVNLGLVIIDEEHDISYKQNESSPRFQARDVALVLAHQHKAHSLLGSATPSTESFYNAQIQKYGYVTLEERFGNILPPEIQLINLKDKSKRKQMTGHFSDALIEAIEQTLNDKKQVILLQNRRGYSPYLQCQTCDTIQQCPNCDVSLTYHQAQRQLRCHYCGYTSAKPESCVACGSSLLQMKGFGTEQVEEEILKIFPSARIDRMDQDTTRGKYNYEKIIHKLEHQQTDILIGTQMVSKGLDFENVTLVGIMNADLFLHQPDFRSMERGFQLLTQISGRAGRRNQQGKVIIQTYNPSQIILQEVVQYQYLKMINEQLHERKDFHYPPFYKIIRITLKDRDLNKINAAGEWFAQSLRQGFSQTAIEVLGAEFPAISRIRNEYIKHILVKIPQHTSATDVKKYILRIEQSFFSIGAYRSVHLSYNVDL
ncbi:MAG: primosomal protein N' [Capnocytophaga sp.]|nr:primosomal protein N' [Capnocytophaga sp.]